MQKRFIVGLCSALLVGAVVLSIVLGRGRISVGRKFTIASNVPSFLPYIESFNQSHQKKAVFLYKSDPLSCLKSAPPPDIIIAPWIRGEDTKKYFRKLNSIFNDSTLVRVYSPLFYQAIVDALAFSGDQYLLPVSFDVPVVIFSKENAHFVTDEIKNSQTITLSEIKKIAKVYKDSMTKSLAGGSGGSGGTRLDVGGFSPQSSDDFLYFFTKVTGCQWRDSDGVIPFTYNEEKFNDAIKLLKEWEADNGGPLSAKNYVNKYLTKPDDKKVTTGGALFAFTTSDKLFCYTKEQFDLLDYRYITADGAIPIEDSLVTMALPKRSSNNSAALDFLEWFFHIETQKELLGKVAALGLDIKTFGLAGGFSTIKEVNEKILPQYYSALKSFGQKFTIFEQKPYNYQEIKSAVIIPYIKDALLDKKDPKSMETRYKDWALLKGE